MKPEGVLFQTGYLTIDKMQITPFQSIEYKLRIPNKEVRMSLYEYILESVLKWVEHKQIRVNIYNVLQKWDLEWLKQEIERLFASIPYNNFTKNNMAEYEWFYASILYAYLQSLGYEIIWEDTSNVWRADLVMIMEEAIYIFEIKTDSKEPPIKQIEERQYYKKYENLWKKIYLVWINFDSKKRNIKDFDWKEK